MSNQKLRMNLLNLDKRWQRFNDAARGCPCCGQTFSGIFDLVMDHPGVWPYGDRTTQGLSELQVGGDGARPTLFAQDGALKEAQDNGIWIDALLDVYAASGQDIRPHLTQD